jgi:hypothetical protein
MSYDPVKQQYTLTVRGVDSRTVQLMRIAATRLEMSQGDAITRAMRFWLKFLTSKAPTRFKDLDDEIAKL